jgi:uncharacterized protein (DUF427 family)
VSATEPKIPGPDHPITIEPHSARVVVSAGEHVIADTTHALALHEAGHATVLYVPSADLDGSVLVGSDTTTYCPYKGTASYHSVRTADGLVQDAIWFYPDPYDAVSQISGHVAFYPDRVDIDDGRELH